MEGNRVHGSDRKARYAALLCAVLVLVGCSYPIMPKRVPLSRDADPAAFIGASLLVTMGQQDAAGYRILTDDGRNSGLRADRKAWTRKLVETLAAELARRGAQVSSVAPATFSVSLPAIVLIDSGKYYELKVAMSIVSSAGWSKEYAGAARTEKRSVLSVKEEMDRLASLALAEAVKALLTDEEFIGAAKGSG